MNENEKQGGKGAAQGRQMPDTAQQAAQEGTRRIKEITNEAAEAGQQAVTATAEAARVGAETMQQTLQAGLDVAYRWPNAPPTSSWKFSASPASSHRSLRSNLRKMFKPSPIPARSSPV